jgi:2-polyprenyl-3-methyl-5-hydroxy-6-metoxy-1,4-benzoquinol methylase
VAVYGVEAVQAPADRAAAIYERIVVGYFPTDLPADLGKFDCVIFNDVLEHLVDPWAALSATHGHLAPDGVVVASIPNVRYLRVLFDLVVHGTFEYTTSGILDRTHLRFFTKRSIVELFRSTGYVIESIQGINSNEGWRVKVLHQLAPGFADGTRFVQYAVVARPSLPPRT